MATTMSTTSAMQQGKDDEEWAKWAVLFGSPARLRVLEVLRAQRGESLSVDALAELLGIFQGTLSHHLRLLRAAGFVAYRQAGPGNQRHYYVKQESIREAINGLEERLAIS